MPPTGKRWHRSCGSPLDEVCEGAERGGGRSANRNTPRGQLEEPPPEGGYDPFGRPAVAVGTVGVRHARVFTLVVQQLRHGRDDRLGTGADEARRTRRDRLRPFGRIAYHEDRLAQRRGLLLNTPGVRDDQVCAHHQIDERQVLLRLDQTDVGEVVQDRAYGLLYVWIEVHRVYDPDIGPLSCYAPQCPAETYELLAEVLASMSGDENLSPVVVEEWKACRNAVAQGLIGTQLLDYLQQGVDYCVARKDNARRIGAFAQQVSARLLRRREVQVGDRIGHSAVHLLRPR